MCLTMGRIAVTDYSYSELVVMLQEEVFVTVSPRAKIGNYVRVWHNAQVREKAIIGDHCNIGRGAYIGVGVTLGKNCKVQNYACIYEGAQLEDGVFIGPHAIITNDKYPRAVNPDMTLKGSDDWELTPTTVYKGASIGAGAVIVGGITIGAWAMVGASSVVVDNVPPHALVVGNPARIIGYVDKGGKCRNRPGRKRLIVGPVVKTIEVTEEQYNNFVQLAAVRNLHLTNSEKRLVEHHRMLKDGGVVVGEDCDAPLLPIDEMCQQLRQEVVSNIAAEYGSEGEHPFNKTEDKQIKRLLAVEVVLEDDTILLFKKGTRYTVLLNPLTGVRYEPKPKWEVTGDNLADNFRPFTRGEELTGWPAHTEVTTLEDII